jgi:hypothetical protein
LIGDLRNASKAGEISQMRDLLRVDPSYSFFRLDAGVAPDAARTQAEAYFSQWGFNFTEAPTLNQVVRSV